MSTTGYSEFLSFAVDFTSASRESVYRLWTESQQSVELKEDSSPVTKLDREIELRFRDVVTKRFPAHGVLGEEYGQLNPGAEFTWVIDPIDGTQSLVNGVPTFGTFLALMHGNDPVVGIIDIPILKMSVAGAVGEGVRDEVGAIIDLSRSGAHVPCDIVAIGTSGCFAKVGHTALYQRVVERFQIARSYYDCFGHYLLATGRVSGLFEGGVPCWDVVATEALVRAAGGAVHYIERGVDLLSRRTVILGKAPTVDAIRAVCQEVL